MAFSAAWTMILGSECLVFGCCEINRKILGAWRERKSREATVGRLCRALWECGATEAVLTLAEEPSTPQP
ncbi:hypothetical protein FJT64_017071 [Amphibalanus amphitrite]|uniref:Uncharacterized protein n=1 Tax=Amphibalanus amphitrite TaxID=1232801 RepID=A0A6A4XAI0_AMPAM|nr:hypothetical protein FJT64_017071 [Amphibalanus amphitrite]